MRDLFLALGELEEQLLSAVGLDLNHALIICALGTEPRLPSALSQTTGLRPAHTSKLLSSLERKALIKRKSATGDRRQVICTLTPQGVECLDKMRALELVYPDPLKALF